MYSRDDLDLGPLVNLQKILQSQVLLSVT